MKSERRHELQQNELADWLARKLEVAKPYGKVAGGVILAAVLVWLTYWALSNRGQAQLAESWDGYFSGAMLKQQPDEQTEELKGVLEKHKDSPAAVLANLRLATAEKNEGIDKLLSDPDTSQRRLNDAIEHFRSAINATKDPLLKQKASYELARTYESQGELERAKKEYEQITKTWPDGAYAKRAQGRRDDLNREATDRFYTWHRSAKLTPGAGDVPPRAIKEPGKNLDELPDGPSAGKKSPDAAAIPDASKANSDKPSDKVDKPEEKQNGKKDVELTPPANDLDKAPPTDTKPDTKPDKKSDAKPNAKAGDADSKPKPTDKGGDKPAAKPDDKGAGKSADKSAASATESK